MDTPIFLSIIIPCYNVEAFVPKTIESLRQLQDADDVEFIFINDGSTDNTLRLLQDFTKSDYRAHIINQVNQGVSAARNNAIATAKGEYMVCLDGDDYLEPTTITHLRQACHSNDVVMAPSLLVRNNIPQLQPWNTPFGHYSILAFFQMVQLFPVTPMLVYRMDIIRQHRLTFNPDLKCGEVLDFTFSVLTFVSTINVIPTPFYNYVMRASSATHAPNCTSDMTSLRLLEHVKQIQQPWAQTPSCWFTTYKVINAFTYNKYLRLHLATKDILDTIHTLLHTPTYRELLHRVVRQSSSPLFDRLFIIYQLVMPSRLGYRLINIINRFIPFVR